MTAFFLEKFVISEVFDYPSKNSNGEMENHCKALQIIHQLSAVSIRLLSQSGQISWYFGINVYHSGDSVLTGEYDVINACEELNVFS